MIKPDFEQMASLRMSVKEIKYVVTQILSKRPIAEEKMSRGRTLEVLETVRNYYRVNDVTIAEQFELTPEEAKGLLDSAHEIIVTDARTKDDKQRARELYDKAVDKQDGQKAADNERARKANQLIDGAYVEAQAKEAVKQIHFVLDNFGSHRLRMLVSTNAVKIAIKTGDWSIVQMALYRIQSGDWKGAERDLGFQSPEDFKRFRTEFSTDDGKAKAGAFANMCALFGDPDGLTTGTSTGAAETVLGIVTKAAFARAMAKEHEGYVQQYQSQELRSVDIMNGISSQVSQQASGILDAQLVQDIERVLKEGRANGYSSPECLEVFRRAEEAILEAQSQPGADIYKIQQMSNHIMHAKGLSETIVSSRVKADQMMADAADLRNAGGQFSTFFSEYDDPDRKRER